MQWKECFRSYATVNNEQSSSVGTLIMCYIFIQRGELFSFVFPDLYSFFQNQWKINLLYIYINVFMTLFGKLICKYFFVNIVFLVLHVQAVFY